MADIRKPTTRELSSVWRNMAGTNSPSFDVGDINAAVEKAVLDGDLPREAAAHAKALAVYAEELIRERGRPEGGTGKETKRTSSDRHFVGGEHEAETSQERELLDVSRTSAKPGVKPVRLAGPDLDPEDADLLRKSLAGKSGKTLASMVIKADETAGLRRSSVKQRPVSEFVGPMPLEQNPLERIRPRAQRPEPEPAQRGSAEAYANRMVEAIKRSGMDVSRGSIPGKSGKGVFFGFKDNPDVPKFYRPKILEEVLGAGEKNSDVFAGVGEHGKSVFDILNERAKAGDMHAAAAFELLKRKHYKTGERTRESQERTNKNKMKPVKGGGFEIVPQEDPRGNIIRDKNGNPIPVKEILGPEDKARKTARNQSREMGQTASEIAFRRSKFDPERVGGYTKRNRSVDQAMPDAPLSEIISALKKARARKRDVVPEVVRGSEQAYNEVPRRRPEFIGPMPLKEVKTGYMKPDRQEAERKPRSLLPALDRLRRIVQAHGGTMPEPPMRPYERLGPVAERGVPVAEVGGGPKARRVPIIKRPGKGPGIKETMFSKMAKKGKAR